MTDFTTPQVILDKAGLTNQAQCKDTILDQLAHYANVAQFVSFDPNMRQRFCRIRGHALNQLFGAPEQAVAALLTASPEHSVNVRSYMPESPKSRRFVYGIKSVAEAVEHVRVLASEGFYTIVNETIDVNDGGVSGVLFGDLVEFAPGDTPRCVEKPGTAAFPRDVGLRILEIVYGFRPALHFDPHLRVEFSLHPLRRGVMHDHAIVWEVERFESSPVEPSVRWPNKFSRLLGDKAFGLLVAHAFGLPVPETTVVSRILPPFRFGKRTGTGENWFRTCPKEQVPGKFKTQHGWLDPFQLMSQEDPSAEKLASILAQEGVDAAYSGGALTSTDNEVVIEGVRGRGDDFMQGTAAPCVLPDLIHRSVKDLWQKATALLGSVRFEWVYDGNETWVVQLHSGSSPTTGVEIYPGSAPGFARFLVSDGLESLRTLIEQVQHTGNGIILVGNVGVTSHMGDVLRRARIPSYLERD